MSAAFVAVGNTWSEYRCEECGRSIIIEMEDNIDDKLRTHKCPPQSDGEVKP